MSNRICAGIPIYKHTYIQHIQTFCKTISRNQACAHMWAHAWFKKVCNGQCEKSTENKGGGHEMAVIVKINGYYLVGPKLQKFLAYGAKTLPGLVLK